MVSAFLCWSCLGRSAAIHVRSLIIHTQTAPRSMPKESITSYRIIGASGAAHLSLVPRAKKPSTPASHVPREVLIHTLWGRARLTVHRQRVVSKATVQAPWYKYTQHGQERAAHAGKWVCEKTCSVSHPNCRTGWCCPRTPTTVMALPLLRVCASPTLRIS